MGNIFLTLGQWSSPFKIFLILALKAICLC